MRYGLVVAIGVIAATSLLAHDPITTKVTWDREIAPIVQARCVSCHSAGGRGPMPLTTYEDARPWARAIREEVLARRMPKWQVVRGYGDFTNDPSLSAFEIALMVAWVDGGAPAFAKASTSAAASGAAMADKSADKTAGKTADKPAVVRNVTIPCASRTLPAGRLIGLRPLLAERGALRLTLRRPDGSAEPLLWVRDFDPAFAETYWLRNPPAAPPGTRLVVTDNADDTCSVTLLFG
ncbi:MAG TPA: cytochrome c [Vicinamibacterales bacterium]|nr:cytochrome c [Vicinamibacterales bacterium]